MRNNIYLISILVLLINACNALTSITIKSTKTILTNASSSSDTYPVKTSVPKTKQPLRTTVLNVVYNPNYVTYTFPDEVARATMYCDGGLRGILTTPTLTKVAPTKGVSTSVFIPSKSISTKTIPSLAKTVSTYGSSKTISTPAKAVSTFNTSKTIPNQSNTASPKIPNTTTKTTITTTVMARTLIARDSKTKETKEGTYYFHSRFVDLGTCEIYTLRYPITTTTLISTTTTSYQLFDVQTIYSYKSGTTSGRRVVRETTSYGYAINLTGTPVTYIQTAYDHSMDNPPTLTCSTTESYVNNIPYISTKIHETPISSELTLYSDKTKIESILTLLKYTEYVTLYSAGTLTSTNCELSYKTEQPSPAITTITTTTTEQPPVITNTITDITEQPLDIPTTTTTEQSPVITTIIEQPPVITTTVEQPPDITTIIEQPPDITTIIEQPPVITTTIEQPPVITTTIEQPPIITTTTKQLPVITTKKPPVITTITKQLPINTKYPPTKNVNCAKKWNKCGGVGYNGPTCCEAGLVCRKVNKYYSRCI